MVCREALAHRLRAETANLGAPVLNVVAKLVCAVHAQSFIVKIRLKLLAVMQQKSA